MKKFIVVFSVLCVLLTQTISHSQQIQRVTLQSDVVVPKDVITTVLVQNIVFPSKVLSWRVLSCYNMITFAPSFSTVESNVTDGLGNQNSNFAEFSSILQSVGVGGYVGGCGISRNVYSGGSTATFQLKIKSFGANIVVRTTPCTGDPTQCLTSTYFDIYLVPSL